MMRRMLLLAGLVVSVVLSTPTAFAWTLMQQVSVAAPATCGPTCTADFGFNTTPNNLVVVVISWPDSTKTISSCSGDAATGWTLVASSLVQNATLNRSAQICYGLASGGNTVSVTWTPSGGFQYWAIAFEYSGNATSSILDQAGALADTVSQTHVTLGNLTPADSNELLVFYAQCDSAGLPTWTKATGWTDKQFVSGSTVMADYQGAPSGSTEFYVDGNIGCTYVSTGASFRSLALARGGLLLGILP